MPFRALTRPPSPSGEGATAAIVSALEVGVNLKRTNSVAGSRTTDHDKRYAKTALWPLNWGFAAMPRSVVSLLGECGCDDPRNFSPPIHLGTGRRCHNAAWPPTRCSTAWRRRSRSARAELPASNAGRWALFVQPADRRCRPEFVGCYDTEIEACEIGYRSLVGRRFLVKAVLEEDPVISVPWAVPADQL